MAQPETTAQDVRHAEVSEGRRLKPPIRPDIPRAKREGLTLRLDEICRSDPDSLSAEDHYRLKTYGICAQRHAGVFMLRVRVPGGRLGPDAARAVTEAAQRYAGGWLHLTTRQNLELHSVELSDVPSITKILAEGGLSLRSTCGHTVRNVVACPEAGVSADEPFDCGPDAAYLSETLVAMSDRLNSELPSRINISLGGCPDCSLEALSNDVGLVSALRRRNDGIVEAGYQLWAAGSLGSAPRLATLLVPFLPRTQLWAGVWSIVHYYLTEGSIDSPAKGRLKFLVEEKGIGHFRSGFFERFEHFSSQNPRGSRAPHQASRGRHLDNLPAAEPLPEIELPPEADLTSLWTVPVAPCLPPGVRLQRQPGHCLVNVAVPLGDVWADELIQLSRIAKDFGDGNLYLTRLQDIRIRNVGLGALEDTIGAVAEQTALRVGEPVPVRACPGLAFCSLAITDSQGVVRSLLMGGTASEAARAGISVAVSGCPNSCTKHQAADIGLAGSKVRVDGRTVLGYQVFVGAELASGRVGEPVARIAEGEVVDAVRLLQRLYEHERRRSETPGQTFRRLGVGRVGSIIEASLRRQRAA